jgi:uncharacterized protein (TIGR02145 family)
MNSGIHLVVAMLLVLVVAGCDKEDNDPAQKPVPAKVTDIDGNVYHTVVIGKQAWLAENLAVTRYRNGDSIARAVDSAAWVDAPGGAACSYKNTNENAATYGRLYNWNAVADPRKICPGGWHVPSETEWSALAEFLGGEGSAGGKLKEAGTGRWMDPNTGATNASGFTALPAGYRNDEGLFANLTGSAVFWTSTEHDTAHGWYRYLYFNYNGIYKDFYHNKAHGFSVRCLMDQK